MMDRDEQVQRYFAWEPRDDPEFAPMILGEGSIGGKGRSLLYGIRALRDSKDPELVETTMPRALFFGSDLFDRFVASLPGRERLISSASPEELEAAFLAHRLPDAVVQRVTTFLVDVTDPVVVRSSSIQEDSLKYSFAGKYLSDFLGNYGPLNHRVAAVCREIRRIYSRVYFPKAISYRERHSIGDDSMGIIIMAMSGKWRGDLFYPTIGGVGFSRNYRRWTSRVNMEDGVVRFVFGLGTMSTKREYARTCSLTNPFLRPEGQDPYTVLRHSQERFQAISRARFDEASKDRPDTLVTVNVNDVWDQIFPCYREEVSQYAQMYRGDEGGGYFTSPNASPSDDRVSRICFTFEDFPKRHRRFFERMRRTLAVLEEAMGVPADVEFAYEPRDNHLELIQARPLWAGSGVLTSSLEAVNQDRVILRADRMVTNGSFRDVRNLVYVDHAVYTGAPDPGLIARSVGMVNDRLKGERFIFVAPGRIGSSNPMLGVPVQYNELSRCCCMVEVGIPRMGYMPELSYGTHFFSDLEVDGVLYMPVFQGYQNNLFRQEWFDSIAYEPGSHPAIRIYRGRFTVFTSAERNLGLVVAE
ncbi:MAG: pyruvate, phosphate dikinase [Dethiosulfovibrio peptidovorans]|nr:MAG: pyruvate, phosphate dikinase [Dethiosulfovibrio peptidovorans]